MESIYKLKGIYRITNKETGMSYIGKTEMNFGDRWDCHKALLRHGKHHNKYLQDDWTNYGENNFEFAIIEIVENDSLLNELEIKYISEYRSINKSYNMHDGGDASYNLGKKLSDETKRKIGDANRVHMTGRKLSYETRRKMSISQNARHRELTLDEKIEYESLSRSNKEDADSRQKKHKSGSKFTPDDIRAIKELRLNGSHIKEIAEMFNTSCNYISSILHGRKWASVN
jgi:group I intron endonuclease